jgi:V/A-type H+-transporting ATPase subunit C
MASVVYYPAINAKIRAITGKMLTEEDFQRLLGCGSVQEVFNYLYNHTYYRENLEKLSGIEIHRRQLEQNLKKSIIEDYHLLSRYLRGGSKEFFKQLFSKFEIEDLKMLLRTILIEHDEGYLKESLIYLGSDHYIDLHKLTNINSYSGLLTLFKKTRYYEVLKRFVDRYEKDRNLFPIEMSLDFQYFSLLEETGKKLGRIDYRYVEELIGAQVDLLNIQWVYRIKKYYNLSSAQILNYIIPFHYRVTREEFKNMSRVKDPDGMANYISYPVYRDLFAKAVAGNNIVFERYFLSYLLQKAIKLKSTSVLNIGTLIAYLFIKEYEIRDIITVVEGVRYSLTKDEIKKFLIREGV